MTVQPFVFECFLSPWRHQAEAHGEHRAGPQAAFDGESAQVTIEDMLDERETQSGAALGAALSDIDAIESLGQTRQMFGRNPRPVVAYAHDRVPSGLAR